MNIWKLIPGKEEEKPAVLQAFLCFFYLFLSWYTIRPFREAMGIEGGAGNLPWLMVGTVVLSIIVNPIIGKLTARYDRSTMARAVYRFLAFNILLFYAAQLLGPKWFGQGEDTHRYIGYAFYIWVSSFSVLIGSLLWSLLTEVFPAARAKHLFGFISAGCSLGGITAGAVVLVGLGLLNSIGASSLHMLLIAAFVLELAARSVGAIVSKAPPRPVSTNRDAPEEPAFQPLKGSAWAGFQQVIASPYLLGISGYILFYTLTGTFAYLIQGTVIASLEQNLGGRVQSFAYIDLATNTFSFLLQVFAVSKLVNRLGLGPTLSILPILTAACFAALWAFPIYSVVLVTQVLRRATNYGLTRPARELLFTPLPTEQKYKAKNFIDVALYRSGDTATSLLYLKLKTLGLALSNLAAVAIPLSLLWLAIVPPLARAYKTRTQAPPD
jgi:AAA family ATP:ADP antiporter